MPGIGSLIREIRIKLQQKMRKQNRRSLSKLMPAFKVLTNVLCHNLLWVRVMMEYMYVNKSIHFFEKIIKNSFLAPKYFVHSLNKLF